MAVFYCNSAITFYFLYTYKILLYSSLVNYNTRREVEFYRTHAHLERQLRYEQAKHVDLQCHTWDFATLPTE